MSRKILNKVSLLEFMWWSESNGQTTAYINIYEKGKVGFEYNNYKELGKRETIEFETYEDLKAYVDKKYKESKGR